MKVGGKGTDFCKKVGQRMLYFLVVSIIIVHRLIVGFNNNY